MHYRLGANDLFRAAILSGGAEDGIVVHWDDSLALDEHRLDIVNVFLLGDAG